MQTTAQSLGALLKSARDIMRKDKGLNGDLGGKHDRMNRIYRISKRESNTAGDLEASVILFIILILSELWKIKN